MLRSRKNKAVQPMVTDRLSRLPRKLMPRMFKGFTRKKTAKEICGRLEHKKRSSTLTWVHSCRSGRSNFLSKLRPTVTKFTTLSMFFFQHGLGSTSTGVRKECLTPRVLAVLRRFIVICQLPGSII
jgi:hypothetical protein